MAFTEVHVPAVTVAALLALDDGQVAQHLQKNDERGGGFVISGLEGDEDLSESQEDEIERKLR